MTYKELTEHYAKTVVVKSGFISIQQSYNQYSELIVSVGINIVIFININVSHHLQF